ncbi:DUF799 domain-containing protein [Neptunomonas japonica]|uniref:DUF799 domain-containing protein n=1 Tax=Neptunomonas japonica TaxID=417574 RepID=UPI0004281592|nr:GNA1162 family protein [Neptunomonas japonica]
MISRFPKIIRLLPAFILVLITGCAQQQQTYDYSAFETSKPKSILVIPPQNNTVEVNAPYIYLSTISRPLAEKGYYVFPVAVIDQLLKQNGLTSPAEMHSIPLEKINEFIAPDAVLYVNIEEWGQKYQVLASTTVVQATLKLVDAKTGTVIWDGVAAGQRSSGDGGGGLAGILVAAIVEQIAGNILDYTPSVATLANQLALNNKGIGIPSGPYIKASN